MYRLYPTTKQAEQLTWILDRCRELYNAALEERREAYRMAGKSLSYNKQAGELPGVKDVRPEYKQVGSQVLQDVLKRVDHAFQAFFRRAKAGQAPGYPRFKNRDRYDSFTYHQCGWKLDGNRLVLAGVGRIKVTLHRAVAGTIKTVTLKRSCGKWYVTFTCEVAAMPLPETGESVGIDLGLTDFLVTDTGERVANPRPLRRAEAGLKHAQQALSRQKRGSHRRRKQRFRVVKQHRKVANVRRDFHHKTARALVQRYDTICHESLAVKNMVQNHCLAKSISDAAA